MLWFFRGKNIWVMEMSFSRFYHPFKVILYAYIMNIYTVTKSSRHPNHVYSYNVTSPSLNGNDADSARKHANIDFPSLNLSGSHHSRQTTRMREDGADRSSLESGGHWWGLPWLGFDRRPAHTPDTAWILKWSRRDVTSFFNFKEKYARSTCFGSPVASKWKMI